MIRAFIDLLKASTEKLHPAYFAMVMGTGIVSVASLWLGIPAVPQLLFVLNIVFFAGLCVLTALRVAWHPHRILADLTDHNRCVGFFTTIAGACVLGVQFVLLGHNLAAATWLWFGALALWLCLTYAIFTVLTVKEEKPPLAEGINGGWLLTVVTTQAVSNLGGLLADQFGPYREQMLFFSLIMWLCGGMLYIWTISLIFYRYTFFKFLPSDLAPPYWINMGAVAISTLAGTRLILNAPKSALLEQLVPFLQGFTLLFWATATWWIPMLVTLAVWRHVYKRYPVAYDPLYWGLVFPLGMYTACTFQLAKVTRLDFLYAIPQVFVYIAILAWLITFLGLVRRITRALVGLIHHPGEPAAVLSSDQAPAGRQGADTPHQPCQDAAGAAAMTGSDVSVG
ncbi:MAG TPA: tellurite resistance/C4-dicarboxylate transporter family protein [Candidatus Obscuribacterales bacterium]